MFRFVRPKVSYRRSSRRLASAVEALEGRVVLSAGDLDPTFGAFGTAVINAGPGDAAVVVTAVDTRLGGTVVASNRTPDYENTALTLTKLNDAGQRDAGFGGGDGQVRLDDIVEGLIEDDTVTLRSITDLLIQPDGKILYTGSTASFGYSDGFVGRLLANGAVDTSFGDGGLQFNFGPAESTARSVTLAPDGKIIVGGSYSDYVQNGDSLDYQAFVVVKRYTANGAPDTSFSESGVVAAGRFGIAYDVAVQNDGKVLVAGTNTLLGSNDTTLEVIRLNTSGSLDAGFASGGIYRRHEGTYGSTAASVAVASNGRIAIGGTVAEDAVILLNPNGTLIAYRGGLTNALNGGGVVNDIAFASDGKVVAWVQYPTPFQRGNRLVNSATVRLNSNGTNDVSFNPSVGGAVFENDGGFGDLQADRKIITAGTINTDGNGDDEIYVRRRLYTDGAPATQTLVIQGTGGNDVIAAARSDATTLRITVNGVNAFYDDVDSRFSRVEIRGLGGNDSLDATDAALPSTLLGGEGNDLLIGSDRDDVLKGEAGEDFLKGRLGADDISGGAGADRVEYNERTAPLYIGLGSAADDGEAGEKDNVRDDIENVIGGAGNDEIHGSGIANRIDAGPGNDKVYGGGGNDVLIGGSGNDLLRGEAGDDALDGGLDADDMGGGSGVDTIDYTSRTANLTVGLGSYADDGESGELDNARDDVETVRGGSGNDRITGSSIGNVLYGGGGNDVLRGGGGNDFLNGGTGLDQLFGEAGNDSLYAREGEKDALDGGAGTDGAQRDAIDSVLSIETFI